jgi:cupin superfamily acireductone dioxygenase involved in methionine salvage
MAEIDIPSGTGQAAITDAALQIAGDGCSEINLVLADIQADNVLGDDVSTTATTAANDGQARPLMTKYGYKATDNANITQASGAMVIDDLMQKISTKVQVASQMLSTANNINKTVARSISQG